jgi:hypothetical protein
MEERRLFLGGYAMPDERSDASALSLLKSSHQLTLGLLAHSDLQTLIRKCLRQVCRSYTYQLYTPSDTVSYW